MLKVADAAMASKMSISRRALLAAAVTIPTVEFMRARPVSPPDPFRFQEYPSTFNGQLWNGNQPYSDTNGRTPLANQTLDTSIRNLIVISTGQSLRINQTPTTYIPTNLSAISNFNVLDGALYPYQEPLLGCGYTGTTPGFGKGFMLGRAADILLSGGHTDRVILLPEGVGGSPVQWWATGPLSDRIPKALARLASRGFVAQTNVDVLIEWGQGEADNTGGTSQATYTSLLNTVIVNARAAGFTGHFYVAQETMFGGVTSSAVAAAQVAILNGTTILPSGNIDSVPSGQRIDGTHLADTGAVTAAGLVANAFIAGGF